MSLDQPDHLADQPVIVAPPVGYLAPRAAITDDVACRAAGGVTGSGVRESTCEQLVSHRLKGSDRQRSESGDLVMTALIAHRLNGRRDRY